MISNIERYKEDLAALVKRGELLHNALQHETVPEQFDTYLKKKFGRKQRSF